MRQPEGFYDDLASRYHLLFADWWLAALEHGARTPQNGRRRTGRFAATRSPPRFRTNGFATVEWLMPERSGHDQPVVLAVADGTPSTGLPGASSGNCAVTVKRPSAHRTTS